MLSEGKWSRKQIEFELEFGEHFVAANEEMLKQVWINLIDNAVKFSKRGSALAVEISNNKNNTLRVSVTNEGKEIFFNTYFTRTMGLPALKDEEKKKLFPLCQKRFPPRFLKGKKKT